MTVSEFTKDQERILTKALDKLTNALLSQSFSQLVLCEKWNYVQLRKYEIVVF